MVGKSPKSPSRGAARRGSASEARPKSAGPKAAPKPTQLKLSITGAQNVLYETEARRYNRRKKIHRRKEIPTLPMGQVIGDALPTRAMSLGATRPAAAAAANAAPAIKILRTIELNDIATADTASHVCEPSCAANGNVIFATGNWFACLSTNGGNSFKYVDPYSAFPKVGNADFCCDQVVLYSARHDRFLWLLQYGEDAKGENVQRVAYATTDDVKAGHWRYVDVSSASLGLKGSWLDFPDLAITDRCLYVTTNAFKGNAWSGTAIVRIDLAKLWNGKVDAKKIVVKDVFNFRVAQNCRDVAYWGTHVTNSRMRVYAWPESAARPKSFEVDIPTWSQDGTYVSKMPDGSNWLERVDGRVVAAALVGNEVWFGWTAGAGGVNARPNPYIQVARIDVVAKKAVGSVNLWDPANAICCPAFGVSAQQDLGVSYSIGGNAQFPSHVVGFLTGKEAHQLAVSGQRSPNDRKWGDYLAVRPLYPGGQQLIASGYTLKNGSDTSDATPDLVVFSR